MRSSSPRSRLAVALMVLVAGGAASTGCGSVDKQEDPAERFTISIAISGSGSVQSTPAGITCGGDCNEAFEAGTSITLSAVAQAGSSFVGWTGGSCAGEGDCTLVVSENVTVQAMFAVAHAVTITTAGNGTGTIVSAPAGISCPPTCSKLFPAGQSVTLTATPGTGTAFMGWTGACTGTAPCTAVTSAAVNLNATFSRALTCSVVANGATCTDGAQPQLNLGMIASTACHTQCQVQMFNATMTSGCWIVAQDGNCYCRSGTLNTGGVRAGGVCN